MATQFLNFAEAPLNFQKLKKNPNNSNLKSFWAFLLSISIYISVFYVFNLSPSTLLSTTTFWFFISNTLILIIAADFEAFSSSKKHDFYDDYVKNNVRPKATTVPCFETQYNKSIVEEITPNRDQEIEKKQEIVSIKDVHEDKLVVENKKEIISFHPERERNIGGVEKKKRKSKCGRSKSDKAILISGGKEEKMVLRRTFSEKNEEQRIEENEFSSMSNEELNRRVEEFIQRSNRQIRLQAIMSRRDLELGRI